MVRRYGVNAVCVMSDDEAVLEVGVRAVLDAWPQVTPAIADDFTERYSRRALTRRLSEVLASVTKCVR
jgi:hypothetical protein